MSPQQILTTKITNIFVDKSTDHVKLLIWCYQLSWRRKLATVEFKCGRLER